MSEEKKESEGGLSLWYSTYGIITVERILERYKINLNHLDLLNALKVKNSFYNQLLRIPLRNVYNGIIFQQGRDYQIYAQKLFIDYLLSGEGSKSEESPGAASRERLEEERVALVAMGERFHNIELEQEKLIADSQVMLIRHAADWNRSMLEISSKLSRDLQTAGIFKPSQILAKCLESLLVQYDLKEEASTITDVYWKKVEGIIGTTLNKDTKAIFVNHLASFNEFSAEANSSAQEYLMLTNEMISKLIQYRSDFKATIVRITELMRQLPEYKMDMAQAEANREDLHFDPDIGA